MDMHFYIIQYKFTHHDFSKWNSSSRVLPLPLPPTQPICLGFCLYWAL